MNGLKNNQGFTLIELVVVIVLLGILAVTAAPKFIDLQSDANTATLQAVKASMQSASSLIRGKSLIKGNEATAGIAIVSPVVAEPFVVVNGDNVSVNFGYPASIAGAALQWSSFLLDINIDSTAGEFGISDTAISGSVIVFPFGSTEHTDTPATCYASYTQAVNANTPPVIVVVDCA